MTALVALACVALAADPTGASDSAADPTPSATPATPAATPATPAAPPASFRQAPYPVRQVWWASAIGGTVGLYTLGLPAILTPAEWLGFAAAAPFGALIGGVTGGYVVARRDTGALLAGGALGTLCGGAVVAGVTIGLYGSDASPLDRLPNPPRWEILTLVLSPLMSLSTAAGVTLAGQNAYGPYQGWRAATVAPSWDPHTDRRGLVLSGTW